MSKYSYYDADGNIFSVKTLRDDSEAELNLGRAVGFIKGSYQGHMYRVENGDPVLLPSSPEDPRNPA